MTDEELIKRYGGGAFTRPSPGGNTAPWHQRELAEHPYYRRRSAQYTQTLLEPQPVKKRK